MRKTPTYSISLFHVVPNIKMIGQYETALALCKAVDGYIMGSGALCVYQEAYVMWQNNDWDIFCLRGDGSWNEQVERVIAKAKEVLGADATVTKKSSICYRCVDPVSGGSYDIIVAGYTELDGLFGCFDLDVCCIAIGPDGSFSYGDRFGDAAARGNAPCKYNRNAAQTPKIMRDRVAKYEARGYTVELVDGPTVNFRYNFD